MTLLLNPHRFGGLNPLTLATWAHAYWTEGPEFQALGLADGASVATFPDEIATADLVQATGANQPTLRSASAGMGGRPVLEHDGTSDRMLATFANIAFPFTVVVVGRVRTLPGTTIYIVSDNPSTNPNNVIGVSSASKWMLSGNNGSASSTGAADTTKHLFRALRTGATAQSLFVDEVAAVATGTNVGSDGLDGLTTAARSDGALLAQLDVAFIGVAAADLSSQEKSDLHTWAQNTYGIA